MAKTRSKHQKDLYTGYAREQRWSSNRRRKLLKLQKEQPNNAQITEALKNIKYRRKTPGTSVLTNSTKAVISLVKGLESYRKGMVKAGAVPIKPVVKQMFTLGARAHDSMGNPLWQN